MYDKLKPQLEAEIQSIKDAGLYKQERVIITPQAADIKTDDGREVINFCANNYLGLSNIFLNKKSYRFIFKNQIWFSYFIR